MTLPLHIHALFSNNVKLPYEVLHRRFGHIGDSLLRRTLDAVEGITLSSKKPKTLCQSCALGKSRRQPVSSASRHSPTLLEVVQADSQGLFPVSAIDGSRSNIKFIDTHSLYLKMETLPNSTAASALAAFKRYVSRVERRTGCLIKNLRTDGGTEFKASFTSFLTDKGIILQKGFPHYHTHPATAEIVHQTVMNLGRAMHIDSHLPLPLYAEAQLTAAYLWNRSVHRGHSITPFEYVYGYRPNVSHLRPFGCIAYAHVYLEDRTKISPTAERCRLIGYLDDDDTEEYQGYKLLRESDQAIVFSRDVVFDENEQMLPIIGTIPFNDTLHGDVFYSPDTRPPSTDLDLSNELPHLTPPPASTTYPPLHYHRQTILTDHILPSRLRSTGRRI